MFRARMTCRPMLIDGHVSKLVWRASRCCLAATMLFVAVVSVEWSWGQNETLEVWAHMRQAAEKVAPSVVQIETLGGLESVEGTFFAAGPATGTIVSADGLILTSKYTIAHQPTTILVKTPSGDRKTAEVISRDHARGLVLLKVSGVSDWPVPEMLSLEDVTVGQLVVAVGRTFQSDRINTNVGIVSAKDRIWGMALQTDAKTSPNNYGGPLVDAQGRVVGILTLLSTRGEGALAGLDWYDSGIGFAVPASDIMSRLDRLRSPEDLYPGKLGITTTSMEQFASPVTVANVGAKSPAADAGLKTEDIIVRVDGRRIQRFPDLKHALGRRYAGEEVDIVVKRGDQELALKATLAKEVDPLKLTWLGVLPDPSQSENGIVIKHVFADSPAAEGNLMIGDRLLSIDGNKIDDFISGTEFLSRYEAGVEIEIEVERNGETITNKVKLAQLTATLPGEDLLNLELGHSGQATVDSFQLEQFPNSCDVIVPNGFTPDGSYGLFVWLGLPGQHDQEELVKNWEALAAQYGVVIIAPHANQERRWEKNEVEVVTGMIQRAINDYQLNTRKVMISGKGPGLGMARRVAVDETRPVSALVLRGALPPDLSFPENQAQKRFYLGCWLSEDQAAQAKEPVKEALDKQGIPVEVQGFDDLESEEARRSLLRWMMTLDRL